MFNVQSSKFKVPLDPKGRFHSEAEKECSKFFQSANAFVKAAKPSAMFKVES
jgi:hypothetical protein